MAKGKNDYVELAVELAGDSGRVSDLRAELRSKMAKSPVCDGKRFAGSFTETMKKIWKDWCLEKDTN